MAADQERELGQLLLELIRLAPPGMHGLTIQLEWDDDWTVEDVLDCLREQRDQQLGRRAD